MRTARRGVNTNLTRDEGVRLRGEVLDDFLDRTRSFSSTALAERTGIGRHTIERWRACGVRNIADAVVLRIVRIMSSDLGAGRELPLRAFEAPDGQTWLVWARSDDHNLPRALRNVGGWLVFRNGKSQRILVPAPPGWKSCTEEELAALCSRAIPWNRITQAKRAQPV